MAEDQAPEFNGASDETVIDGDAVEVPQQPVVPIEPVAEHVDVECGGGCGNIYGFDIKSNTETFTFECQRCKTKNLWSRA